MVVGHDKNDVFLYTL